MHPTKSQPESIIQFSVSIVFGAQHPHSMETLVVAQTRYISTSRNKTLDERNSLLPAAVASAAQTTEPMVMTS